MESNHKFYALTFFVSFLLLGSCSTKDCKSVVDKGFTKYDMRSDLSPSRLTIAMWDFSWLNQHYKGGYFEDYNKVFDELIERGFNTVRIDAFPLLIGKMVDHDEKVTISGAPLENWGATDEDRKHAVIIELLEFMRIAKEKNISVILSSWALDGIVEYPNLKEAYTDPKEIWKAWEKVLDLLKKENLLTHVLYVDFDQEFPFFSPLAPEISRLGRVKEEELSSALDAMEAAGSINNSFDELSWNHEQMVFVRNYLESTLVHFQQRYPELRFTFSFTSYWKEVRAMNIKNFDVLELHFWMSQSERFISRSGFSEVKKDRADNDYSEYMDRITKTMNSVRPMLLKDMHNRLAWAKDWSDEVAAPLVTTEAWGPWWHMDHEDLSWDWLYEWCKEGVELSAEYELWGTTPWNYSHPYWDNWSNVEWYKEVNTTFLNK